jgi:hypothetical protein
VHHAEVVRAPERGGHLLQHVDRRATCGKGPFAISAESGVPTRYSITR